MEEWRAKLAGAQVAFKEDEEEWRCDGSWSIAILHWFGTYTEETGRWFDFREVSQHLEG